MTDYNWIGITPDASVGTNWAPTGVPNTSSDTAIFATANPCDWNIATCGIIDIKAAYVGVVTIRNAVALTGLSVGVSGKIDMGGAFVITFSGTPPYNSGKSHIKYDYSTDDSPFRDATARGNTTFKMNGSSQITYDSGIYPHILLSNGSHTPDYATISGTRTNQIKFLSFTVNSGATFAPASTTPTANDRLRKWISETAAQSQFAIDSGVSSFNGGYAEWTFQATSSGFIMPSSGTSTYNGCLFTFDKMVLDASIGGVGKWAKLTESTRLQLTDLTINTGASLKGGHNTLGCAILLVNKPTIHGTWGFMSFADGVYIYPKTGETLGVADGGTGLNSVTSGNVLLGNVNNKLAQSDKLNFNTTTDILTLNGELNHDGNKIGFFATAPQSKTSVADITPAVVTPAGGPAPAADHASTAAAIAALESKMNELLDSLQSYGLV